MSPQNRREFLEYTGAAVGLGSALSASGCLAVDQLAPPVAAAATSDHAGLPALRGPYADEDWVGYRGGPGNTAATDPGPAVGDAPDCRPLYQPEQQFNWEAAIVGDTIYITSSGRFRALNTDDGSVRWTSDDVGVNGTPSAAYDRLFGTGGGSVTALDVDDQSVAWDVPYKDKATTPTVGYEMVFAVVDGAIRAMAVEDGSTVWEGVSDETGEDFQYDTLALGAEQVYAIDGSDRLVALDAANGDQQWTDTTQLDYSWGLAATDQYVAGSSGRNSEEYRVLDAATGEVVAGGTAWRPPALDDEAIVNVTHWDVRVDFFDDRDGWQAGTFSTMAVGPPAMDDDTVYVYVGNNGPHDEDSFTIIAYDKYSGERKWSCEVDDSVDGGGSVAITGDAVFAFGSGEFHVVDGDAQGEDPSDGEDDGTSADDNTDGGDASGDDTTADGEDDSTDDDSNDGGDTVSGDGSSDADATATETETTPDEFTPGGNSSPSTGGVGSDPSTDTGADSSDNFGSDGGTPTNETSTGDEDGSIVEGAAVREATETEGKGPGFGVVSTLTGLGGLGYLLRRRLGDDAANADDRDR